MTTPINRPAFNDVPEWLVLYAVRYALPRHSAAPSDVADWVAPRLAGFSDGLLDVLSRDVADQLRLSTVSPVLWGDCDIRTWQQFAARVAEETQRRAGR